LNAKVVVQQYLYAEQALGRAQEELNQVALPVVKRIVEHFDINLGLERSAILSSKGQHIDVSARSRGEVEGLRFPAEWLWNKSWEKDPTSHRKIGRWYGRSQ
jgi:hypothetical protein